MAKSIFASGTFQGATLTLISSLGAIAITCSYEYRKPSQEEAIAILGFFTAYVWTILGRAQNTPVWTPNNLPGANKSDFEKRELDE